MLGTTIAGDLRMLECTALVSRVACSLRVWMCAFGSSLRYMCCLVPDHYMCVHACVHACAYVCLYVHRYNVCTYVCMYVLVSANI